MRIPQEAFSVEEGNRLYRKLSMLLADKYQAKPIDDLTTVGWNGDIKVPVPGTPLAVAISLDRTSGGDWIDRRWDSAKIKVGVKRWQKLTWEDGEWAFDAPKLLGKINVEILKLKGEYAAQNAEKLEMETNRRLIAQDLDFGEELLDHIEMSTPFLATIHLTWADVVIVYQPGQVRAYTLKDIRISSQLKSRMTGLCLNHILGNLELDIEG